MELHLTSILNGLLYTHSHDDCLIKAHGSKNYVTNELFTYELLKSDEGIIDELFDVGIVYLNELGIS